MLTDRILLSIQGNFSFNAVVCFLPCHEQSVYTCIDTQIQENKISYLQAIVQFVQTTLSLLLFLSLMCWCFPRPVAHLKNSKPHLSIDINLTFKFHFQCFSFNGEVVPFSLMWESYSCTVLDLSGAGSGEWENSNHSTSKNPFGIIPVISYGSNFLNVDICKSFF